MTAGTRATVVVADDRISSVGSWAFVSLLLLCTAVALCVFALVAFTSREQLARASKRYRHGHHRRRRRAPDGDDDGASVGDGDPRDRATRRSRQPSRRRDIYGERRIPPFQRDGIVVPDRGADTRDCDDLHRPVVCNVHEGYVACFACVESRLSLRVCAHVDHGIDNGDGGDSFVLPANGSRDLGYCVRESLARELLRTAGGDDGGGDRTRCSANNADWILARTRTADAATHNFVCRCKYPHLMTNSAGPLSPCTRDVGCNGHGRLDEDSRAQRTDPFVNGRCLCESGWVAEYDAADGGPYCREATFAEWPSRYVRGVIDLYADSVDSAFREFIAQNLRDNAPDRNVYLPDPCDAPCALTREEYRGELVWFCSDGVDLVEGDRPRIRRVGIAVRRDRDYLAGNGGRYPNACLVLEEDDIGRADTIALQYMSQEWNVGGAQFAQELGLLISKRVLGATDLRDFWRDDRYYGRFAKGLKPATNRLFSPWGMIWTYTAEALAGARRRLNWLLKDAFWSSVVYDPLYESDTLWFDFPYYCQRDAYKGWFCYVAGTVPPRNVVPRDMPVRPCAWTRGLRAICIHDDLGHKRELGEREAQLMGYGIVPVCWADTTVADTEFPRPEIDCRHPNPTGCVFFVGNRVVLYQRALSYPNGMDMRHLCCTRSNHREIDPACRPTELIVDEGAAEGIVDFGTPSSARYLRPVDEDAIATRA